MQCDRGCACEKPACKHNEDGARGEIWRDKGQKMEQNTPFFHTYAQFAQGYAQQSTGMSTGGHDIIHKTCRQNALESGGGRIVK